VSPTYEIKRSLKVFYLYSFFGDIRDIVRTKPTAILLISSLVRCYFLGGQQISFRAGIIRTGQTFDITILLNLAFEVLESGEFGFVSEVTVAS